jgi:predicted transcriptional regulator
VVLAASGGGGGTSTAVTVESGAVQVVIQPTGPGGTVSATDLDAIREAVEEVFDEVRRRGY